MTLKLEALSAIARSRKCSTDQISVMTSTRTIVPRLVRVVRNRLRRTFLKMITPNFTAKLSSEPIGHLWPEPGKKSTTADDDARPRQGGLIDAFSAMGHARSRWRAACST